MEAIEFMKVLGEKMNKIQQFYHRWAKSQGINYNILAVMYVSYRQDGCSQKNICDEWGIHKQTVNAVCMRLTADGVITQVKNSKDKRETCISLTEKGKQIAAPIVEKLFKIERNVISHMGEEKALEFLKTYSGYSDFMEIEFTKSVRSV